MQRRSCQKNPSVATHPDLFEPGDTRVVKLLEEMTEEEIRKLPREAFSDDEWERLSVEDREAIVGPEEEEEEEGPNQERIDAMVEEFVKRHIWAVEPDDSYLRDQFEGEEDFHFGEAGQHRGGFVGFIRESGYRKARAELEELEERFTEEGFSEEQIQEALNEALEDRDNWETNYGTDENHMTTGAVFKLRASSSFYIDREDLDKLVENMTDEEIEEALAEINRKTYLSLKPKDVDRKGIEIDSYADHHADMAPDWEKIKQAAEATLSDADPEALSAPEDRILYRFEDGSYVVDLLSSELKAEGRGRNICVGSSQYGYGDAIDSGTGKILSLRDPDGTRRFTIEVRLEPYKYVAQVKKAHNALPTASELPELLEFLQKGLGLPMRKIKDIADLKPALREAKLIGGPKKNPDEPDEVCPDCGGPATGFCQPAEEA